MIWLMTFPHAARQVVFPNVVGRGMLALSVTADTSPHVHRAFIEIGSSLAGQRASSCPESEIQ